MPLNDSFAIKTKSSTHLPIGPIVVNNSLSLFKSAVSEMPSTSRLEIRRLVGWKPYMPHHALGILILPPISEPILMGAHLVATKPAEPPELPPGVLVGSRGFKERPHILFSHEKCSMHCGVEVVQ